MQPWVKLQLEDEMFLITNQPCLAATEGRSNLRRQSDSVLCQKRQAGPNKMLAHPGVFAMMCGDVVLTPWYLGFSSTILGILTTIQMDIFAFVESFPGRNVVCTMA